MSRRVLIISALSAAAYWLVDAALLVMTADMPMGAALVSDGPGALPVHRIAATGLMLLVVLGAARRIALGQAREPAPLLQGRRRSALHGKPSPSPAPPQTWCNGGGPGGGPRGCAIDHRNRELEAIFSNLDLSIAVLDCDFNVVRVNDAFAHLAGAPPAALIGRNFFAHRPQIGSRRVFQQVIDTGIVHCETALILAPEGQPGPSGYWDWTLSPLRHTNRTIVGAVLTLADVTRRVHDRAEIERLNRLYNVLSEANKAITRIKEQGALLRELCRIIVTTGGFRLTWIGVPDPQDRAIIPIAHAGDDSSYLENVHISLTDPSHAGSPAITTLRTGLPVTIDDIAEDARFRPWAQAALKRGYRSATTFLIRLGNEPFGVLAALSGEPGFFAGQQIALMSDLADDISFALDALEREERRMAAEEALHRAHEELERRVARRTAELERMNRQLESFSYSVSHDLRGPLRAINGFSGVLMEEHYDRLDDDGRDALLRIQNATRRMDGLMDGLLTLSRIARADLQPVRVDLSSVARQVISELRESDPERRVEFICPDDLQVVADADLVRVALDNLLGNAWKFTGNQPAPAIEVGRLRSEEGPVYFIRDNGAGFDMSHSGNLFGAFQRLHSPEEFPGTGIGLATVARIIQAHGGWIRGEGQEGVGATFYFTFGAEGALPLEGVANGGRPI